MSALDIPTGAGAASSFSSTPARSPVPTGSVRGRNPRLRAVSAYAIPFLPAVWLLFRERRNHFVRVHAARSLTFFFCLALAQIIFFAALVLIGGAITGPSVAELLGVAFYAAYILIVALGFIFWLLLMRDALAGRATSYPLLGGCSRWLEAHLTSLQNRLFPLRAI